MIFTRPDTASGPEIYNLTVKHFQSVQIMCLRACRGGSFVGPDTQQFVQIGIFTVKFEVSDYKILPICTNCKYQVQFPFRNLPKKLL